MTKDDTALLDDAAASTLTDEEFDARRELYKNSEALRVPATIETHAPGGSRHIYIDWKNEA